MNRVLSLATALAVTLLASTSSAIDAPTGTVDLRAGVETLARQFDSEQGQHRLLVLLSPA